MMRMLLVALLFGLSSAHAQEAPRLDRMWDACNKLGSPQAESCRAVLGDLAVAYYHLAAAAVEVEDCGTGALGLALVEYQAQEEKIKRDFPTVWDSAP